MFGLRIFNQTKFKNLKFEIYKIETGKRTVVDYELCGFAKVFNIKLEDLVSDYIDKI